MTTREALTETGLIRIDDYQTDRPVRVEEGDRIYRAGTYLCGYYYDDGDRFLSIATDEVLYAWDIG